MDNYRGKTERKNSEIRPGQLYSARIRAAQRRRKRQIRQRILLTVMAAVLLILVGGTFLGISHYRTTKEKKELIMEAVASLEKQDYSAAIALVDQELEKSQGKIGKLEQDALFYRAEAEYYLGDYDAAIRTYDILEQNGNKKADQDAAAALKANIYNHKAVALIGEKNVEGALEAINQGIALAGENQELLKKLEFNQAVAYEYKQDYDRALTLFRRYVTKYGSSEEAEHEIDFLESRVGGESPSQ